MGDRGNRRRSSRALGFRRRSRVGDRWRGRGGGRGDPPRGRGGVGVRGRGRGGRGGGGRRAPRVPRELPWGSRYGAPGESKQPEPPKPQRPALPQSGPEI